MPGVKPSANDIQYAAGQTALGLKKYYDNAVALNDYFLRTTDEELIAIGISQEDVTILKSALADLAYQKAQAFDSSQPVKRLWGMGII